MFGTFSVLSCATFGIVFSLLISQQQENFSHTSRVDLQLFSSFEFFEICNYVNLITLESSRTHIVGVDEFNTS